MMDNSDISLSQNKENNWNPRGHSAAVAGLGMLVSTLVICNHEQYSGWGPRLEGKKTEIECNLRNTAAAMSSEINVSMLFPALHPKQKALFESSEAVQPWQFDSGRVGQQLELGLSTWIW
jgi:hypothetical protein